MKERLQTAVPVVAIVLVMLLAAVSVTIPTTKGLEGRWVKRTGLYSAPQEMRLRRNGTHVELHSLVNGTDKVAIIEADDLTHNFQGRPYMADLRGNALTIHYQGTPFPGGEAIWEMETTFSEDHGNLVIRSFEGISEYSRPTLLQRIRHPLF